MCGSRLDRLLTTTKKHGLLTLRNRFVWRTCREYLIPHEAVAVRTNQASPVRTGCGNHSGRRAVNLQGTTDVFVVGGGPSGLAAAIAARQAGFDVTLADGSAPPIEKPCGEGLMPETIVALRDLGVTIAPSDGVRFRGICFTQKDACVAGDFPSGAGVGLRRTTLHERLVARARDCGVKLLWQSPVVAIGASHVELAAGRIATRWIVGADGQSSRVRRWIGIETKHIQRRYATRRHFCTQPWSNYVEIHWGARAQAYVTPVGPNEICIVMISVDSEAASFERALGEFPEIQQRIAGAKITSRERGAVTSMHTLRSVQRGRVALVGDASGGVDAITGEGIRLGLRQASALAEAMVAGNLQQYEKQHRELATRPARMGRLLLWLDRNPKLRTRVILAFQSKPELFARTLAMHVGHGSAHDILFTGTRLGWRLLSA
jgi:flavin-dependent dehydrogenase